MTETLKQLAWVRVSLRNAIEHAADRREGLEASSFWHKWSVAAASVDELRARVADIEQQARAEVLAEYAKTGNKKPWPGTGVRVRVVMECTDEKAALEWCKKYHLGWVKEMVDWKAFKATMKKTRCRLPEFMRRTEIPGATLADLSAYLPACVYTQTGCRQEYLEE